MSPKRSWINDERITSAMPTTRPHIEAKKYIGQQEIRGNQGFVNPAFEAEMKEEGFEKGYAWCMLFARVVFVNCYPEKAIELRKLFVPGVLNTFRNLQNAAYPVGNLPQLDSLVCWKQVRNGKPTGFGHAGIVSSLGEDHSWKSIEGNTSTPGEREGYIVAEHSHKISTSLNGLQLLGFVQISAPTTLILNV